MKKILLITFLMSCSFFYGQIAEVSPNDTSTDSGVQRIYQNVTITGSILVDAGDIIDYWQISKSNGETGIYNMTVADLDGGGVGDPDLYIEKRDGSYSGAILSRSRVINGYGGGNFTLDYSSGDAYYLLVAERYNGGNYQGDYQWGISGFVPVACANPVNAASIVTSTPSETSFLIDSYSSTGATGYIVEVSDGSFPNTYNDGFVTLPSVTGTVYSGSGSQVVYVGTSISPNLTITGLTKDTNYSIKVTSYNNCSGFLKFAAGFSTSLTTCGVIPGQASAIVTAPGGTDNFTINSFTAPTSTHNFSALGYVVKVNTADSFTVPTDGATLPTADTAFNNTGEQVVYVGASVTPNANITGLIMGTQYFVRVYAYNTCNGIHYFEAIGGSTTETTCGHPTTDVSSYFYARPEKTTTSNEMQYGKAANATGSVIYINDVNNFVIPTTRNSSYTIETVFRGPSYVDYHNTGQQVVRQSALPSAQFTVTGLSQNTTYYYQKVDYNLCDGIYYYTAAETTTETTCPYSNSIASSPIFGTITSASMEFNSFTAPVTASVPSGYIIKMNTTNSFTPIVNGSSVPTGDPVYSGGEQIVYSGTSTNPNLNITGLTANTDYFFVIYGYYDVCGAEGNLFQQSGYQSSETNNTSKIAPTITFNNVTKSFGDSNFNVTATSNSTGAITYQIISQTGGGTSISGNTITLGNAGTVSIEAVQEPDATYTGGVQIMTLTIEKISPTITGNINYQVGSGETALDLSSWLTSDSDGNMTFGIEGPDLGYTVSGANNEILNLNDVAGSIIIKVTQSEGTNYLAGESFITTAFYNAGFTPKIDMNHNLYDFSLNFSEIATIISPSTFTNTPITYSIVGVDPTGSSIVANVFTAGAPGILTLRASSIEDFIYNETTTDVTVTVLGTLQTITFNPLSDVQVGDPSFLLTAIATSGLDVTYTSSNPAVATVSGNSVTIIGTGTTNITASQAGDAIYFPATNVVQSLTVNPEPLGNQTIIASPTSGTCSVDVMVSLGGSQTEVDYYLRDDATNTIVSGPLVGTGNNISFAEETVTADKTYNVFALPTGSREGNYFQFDGVDGYVSMAGAIASAITGNAITMETWAYIPSTDDTDQYTMLVGQEFNGTSIKFALYIQNGLLQAGFYNAGWNQVAGYDYPKDEWIHIAATYDQANIRLYVNGVEENTIASTAALPTGNTNEWRMGRRWDQPQTSQYIFGGALAETRIWNETKSVLDINTNMNTTITSAANLIASYTYATGTGTTIADQTGNGYTGTLQALEGNAVNWKNETGLEMTNKPSIMVTQITDHNVTLVQPTFDTAIVSLEGSDIGMEYYLRDHADNSIIEGPIAGTGSEVSFATDAITADKTYNVLATDVNPANGFKKAFSFDGVDDYALIPSTVGNSLTTLVTVETNVYIPSSDDTDVNASIITSEVFNDGFIGDVLPLHVSIMNGQLYAGYYNQFDSFTNTPLVAYPKDEWFHVAASSDGATIILYVNGVQVASTPFESYGLYALSANWRVGRSWEAANDASKVIGGSVANTRIWNVVRSAPEVLGNKDIVHTTPQTGLVANYNYTETSGTSIADVSGNGNTATGINILGDATNWQQVLTLNGACGGVQMTNTPTATHNKIEISPKAYLQGAALNPNTGEETLMRDDLRVAGLIPTTSPYSDGLTCASTVFNVTGNDAIVDWVWVELRDETDNTIVIDGKSALLQRDGDVVAIDGVLPLDFIRVDGNYYVIIKHRNHLGIMTATAMALGQTLVTIDFTDANNQITFGTNAQTTFGMPSGVVAMWAANVNGDNQIRYQGSGNDSNTIKDDVLAESGNTSGSNLYQYSGYSTGDVDMNGNVRYQGSGNDSNTIKDIILAHPENTTSSNLFSHIAQLPEN